MMEYIRELLGLADDELNDAREWHAFWVTKIVVGIDLLMLVGFLLNLGGLMWVNLVLSWILATVTIILATRPEGPATAASLGVLSGATQEKQPVTPNQAARTNTILSEAGRFLKVYAQWSATALFWASGILLALGTVPVEENPKAALVILATVIVIFSYVIAFIPTFVIARKVLYTFACIMFVASLFSLVPRHTWIHYTGYDVKGIFTSNPTEIGVSNIESKAEKARQKRNAKMLQVIERKAEQSGGKPLDEVLSPEELQLFVNLSKQRDARSWKNKLSSLFEHREAKAALAPPPPPPPTLKEKRTAVLPATPPPPQTPIVVTPNPLPPPEHKVPDWKVTEEGVNYGVFHKMTLRSTVEFSRDRETVTIHQQYGNWYVFKGKRVGKFRYEGTWQDEFPRDQYYYWGEFGIEFAPDMQSACGWKTTRDDADNRVKTVWEYIPRQ